jgi:hypothetical protein
VSGHFGFRVVSGRVSNHLVLGHFGFRVVSGQVRSGIGSSSVGSFQVSGRIKSDRVVQYQIISDYEPYQIKTSRMDFSNQVGFCHISGNRKLFPQQFPVQVTKILDINRQMIPLIIVKNKK